MPFCKNCGVQLEENVKFCPECGTSQLSEQATPPTDAPVAPIVTPQKASGTLNIGMLIWSILNLLFCCMPLGIASLIVTVLAKDAPTSEEEAKKIKTAKICNLIGTIGSAIIYALYFVFVVVLALLSVG